MTSQRLMFNVCILGLWWCLFLDAGRCDDRDTIPNAEYTRRNGAPCVTAQYGPYKGIFKFDTGSSVMNVTGPRSLFESPDPTWRISKEVIQFATGVRGVARISGIEVSAFGLPPRRSDIAYRESRYMEKAGFLTNGVVGVEQVQDIMLRIDLRDNICQPDMSDQLLANWTLLPVVDHFFKSPKVFVELPIIGEQKAVFDTGFGRALTLNKETIGILRRAGKVKSGPVLQGMSPIGPNDVQTYFIQSVKLGGFEFQDVQVGEADLELIGCDLFQAFDMMLDLSHDKIWLKPHEKNWPVRVPPDASGLVMTYYDANLLKVVRMQPDSPAIHCGLREGDQVLLFDGKMPKDLSMLEIRKRLTQAGTTIPLKILRESQEVSIDLPLSYAFEYPPKWPQVKSDADAFFKSLQEQETTPIEK